MTLIYFILFVVFLILAVLWLLNKLARNGEQAQVVGQQVRSFWKRVVLGWTLLMKGWHDKSNLTNK